MLRTDKQRAALSYAIRRAQKTGDWPQYPRDQIERIIKAAFLPNAYEQADNLIRWLGDTLDGPGEFAEINLRDHGAILGSLLTLQCFSFPIKEMLKSGVLDGNMDRWTYEKPDGGTSAENDAKARITLSFAGWRRYEELKRGSASGNIAFMAMEYGDPQLDEIIDKYFRPAVFLAGFTLQRLDDQPRAGLIDDRLRVEIRGCRFLIADLSHGNRGAHWEAGYAEGLGKPVIYTCRNDVFDNPNNKDYPHFDTNHHLTVSWDPDNIEIACQKLKETIRATMPDARQQD